MRGLCKASTFISAHSTARLKKRIAIIKDLRFPVHFQFWIQIAQLRVTSQSTVSLKFVLMCGVLSFCILMLPVNPLIKAVCLLEDNFE
jgi:hypothetical protein